MNRIIPVTLSFFFLILSYWATGQESFSAMTYNLRLDVASDGPDNWHRRKADLADYISERSPDFLGVQEALIQQVSYLDDRLSAMAYTGTGREGGENGEFCALFYHSGRWELLHSETFWLSETPEKVSMGWDAACRRVCTYGIFRNAEGFRLAVFNTHFDHVGDLARRKSAGLILARIQSLDPELPVILMGDLNVLPDNPVYQEIAGALLDSGLVRQQFTGNTGTFNGFKMENFEDRRIDYIFYNDRLIPDSYSVEHPLTSEGRQLSDHFPVIASFKAK
jgi:endonuclease/exonuclease/phosphatase family metal-dependent hydrolase